MCKMPQDRHRLGDLVVMSEIKCSPSPQRELIQLEKSLDQDFLTTLPLLTWLIWIKWYAEIQSAFEIRFFSMKSPAGDC